MATAAKRLCKCGGIVSNGTCSKCGPRAPIRTPHARTTTERGYDYRWRRLSESRRREIPVCVRCWSSGITRWATSVHHVVKIVDAPELRLDRDNTLTVCESCHAYLETATAGEVDEIKKVAQKLRDGGGRES